MSVYSKSKLLWAKPLQRTRCQDYSGCMCGLTSHGVRGGCWLCWLPCFCHKSSSLMGDTPLSVCLRSLLSALHVICWHSLSWRRINTQLGSPPTHCIYFCPLISLFVLPCHPSCFFPYMMRGLPSSDNPLCHHRMFHLPLFVWLFDHLELSWQRLWSYQQSSNCSTHRLFAFINL